MRYRCVAIVIGVLCFALGCEPIERDEPAGGTSSNPPQTATSGTETSSAPEASGAIESSVSPALETAPSPMASSETPDWKNIELVHSDVTSLFNATVKGDLDKLVFFAHPSVIADEGGEANAKRKMQMMMNQIKQANMQFDTLKFLGEPQFLESEVHYFVVVPSQIVVRVAGTAIPMNTYHVGARKKTDADWKYIEGVSINEDNAQDRFPDFPSDYTFPELMLPTG